MRILHVVAAFGLGGAEESVSIIAAGLARHGHQCCVAAVTQGSEKDGIGDHLRERLSKSGVDYLTFGKGNIYIDVLKAALGLTGLIKKWKPDIVHANTDVADMAVALALRLKKFPVARTIRNSVLWPTRHLSGLISERAFGNELVIHLSADTKIAYRELRRKYGLPESNLQIEIPNCVETLSDEHYLHRTDLVNCYGANPSKIQFFFAGRFDRQKGLDVLIEAISELPKSYAQKIELHAFGDGVELPAYEHRVAETGVPVKFHAPVPGIWKSMRAFDVVIIPSRFEGFSRVALEGMSAGVPVIVTSAKGLRDTVPPDWPLVVEPENPTALKQMMMDFIDGKIDLPTLIEAGRNRVNTLYSLDSVIEQYDQAYRKYLSA